MTAAGLLELQRDAGNRAVTSMLTQLWSVQRDVGTISVTGMDTEIRPLPPAAKPPSDIDLGFNALDIAHRLIESIDQSQKKLLKKGDPGYVEGVAPIAREINFSVVHEQLSGLTASQVKEVDARYREYAGRPLYVDLLGRGESGAPPNLSVEQIMRLKALLAGTRAEAGQDPELAAQNQREADAYEIRGILKGNPKTAEVARVMTLLRRTPEEAEKLERLYDGNWNLRADLLRMGYINAIRAMLLLSGTRLAADAYEIRQHRYAIVEIDKKLALLDPPEKSATDLIVRSLWAGLNTGTVATYAASIAALKSQRKTHVDAIEEVVKLTAEEARSEAEATTSDVLGIDEAIRSRVASVLGGDDTTERAIGGTQSKLINAIARADPSEQAAAELRKLDERGQLTTEVMGQAFHNLRQQAELEASRLFPDDTAEQLTEHTRQLSDQWFIHLRTTWDASVTGTGRTFDQLLDRGKQSEVDYKRTLYMASGKVSDVDELVLALRGDRKDMETVKRVLRNKTRDEIDELKRQYKIKTTTTTNKWGGSLDEDLLGFAPTRAGQKDTTESDDPKGKAQGTDRLLIEDYLQRPYDEGGKEEVDYIVGRAEREHEYTIANRGATGWWRDHWGNEALSLLNATLKEVHEKRDRYYALTKNGTDVKAMRSEDAKVLIREIHFARATIRGDRAGYEKATAELRATFQTIASFVLQAVLTAVLTPAAAAIFRGISAAAAATRYGIWLRNTVVSISSTISANKAVYGNQYTKEMLYADLRGGLGGAIGSAAVGKLVDPIAGRLQARLGKEMAGEFIEGVKSYGGLQATAVLEGDGLVTFDEFAKQHFLGKVGERITHVTAKGLEHVGYGPGPTHAPYDPDAPSRPRTATGGPEPTGTETREPKASAEEPDVDADYEPPPTPMALPPDLNKPTPRAKARAADEGAGKEHTAPVEEPPKGMDKPADEGAEPAHSDVDTHETALTPEMERQIRRDQEMARRAAEHPLDEASLRSSTAPTAATRALAADFVPLFERFKTVKEVVQRNHAIAEIIRGRLDAEGVYEVRVMPADNLEGARAEFDVIDWEIRISSQMLAVENMTVEQFSDLIEAATHEARHALHHWRGLRAALQPNGGFNPKSLITPNKEAVAAARAANEANVHPFPSDEARREALEVYNQTFGVDVGGRGGQEERRRIKAVLDTRRKELEAARKAVTDNPEGSTKHDAAVEAEKSAYRAWRDAHNRYVKLPQETDAFRRGMAMRAAVAEGLLTTQIDAARLLGRKAHKEQVDFRRSGETEKAQTALNDYNEAMAKVKALTDELNKLPHRTGRRTTLEEDLAFAREARDQARREAEHAQQVGDEPARQEAIARFREAAQEIREIQQEIAQRGT